MLQRIRKSYLTKGIAVLLAFNLVGEIAFPTIAFGLTSGPIDINQVSFEPASTSEMVNLATGDFTYNIPLMDVDGYPINIAYHGGVSMEQEASMVGLGWTLNVGAMNRMKRGLPDDFNGDVITSEMNVRPVRTLGGTISPGVEFVGKEGASPILTGGLSASYGISHNNYRGYSVDFGLNANGKVNIGSLGLGVGAGLESSSSNGLSISSNLAISVINGSGLKMKVGIGFTTNSLQGLQSVNMNAGIGIQPGSKYTHGGGTTSSLPISSVAFTPSISFERNVNLRSFDFDYGMESLPFFVHVRGSFFQSLTCLETNTQEAKAYGYLYEQNKRENEDYLLDFNRDGPVLPSKYIANLPVTNHTFDLYNATAQGVGFSSRPFRSDVQTVSDTRRKDDIRGGSFSGELGIGSLFQAGLNINFTNGYLQTGTWSGNNDMKNIFDTKSNPSSLYEHAYFKKLGNRSASNTDFYNNLGQDAPLTQDIDEAGVSHQGKSTFHSDLYAEGESVVHDFSGDDHFRETRDLRNTNIEFLTADEATSYGFDVIKSCSLNDFDYTGGDFSSSTEVRYGEGIDEAKKHHLSEMTVLKGDGSRYIYGVPVINKKTEEVAFNVSNEYPSESGLTDLTTDCQTGLIEYSPGQDNSLANRRGDNNFYLKKSIPASANSHLLSAYLSSNYIDRTGNGPTPDDFGGYTKFNYSKVSTSSQPTKWRIPFEQNSAAFNEGLKSNTYDDMGSYIYGEREQWLIHSIESKNFVAVFEYGEREDAYGVADENGGIAAYNNSKRLISISLYTRQGLENGDVPIKTVHFEYNYDLCKGVPNNQGGAGTDVSSEVGVENDNGGKLTLTGIYFTYGASNRGKLHKYKFDYSDLNPDYSLGETDRWGTYQQIIEGASCDPNDPLTNFEFPYTKQDKAALDDAAGAWMMDGINLPSGSRIDIEFESDDYSHVMEKEASKMFKIRGMSEGGGDPTENILYDNDGDRNYIHVELDQNLGTDYSTAKEIFKSEYVGDIEQIYFKFLVSVSDEDFIGTIAERFEYVSGYADIDTTDIYVSDEVGSDGLYDTGLIRLKSVYIKDKDKDDEPSAANGISPISKASWQFMRKYLPQSIYPIAGDIYTDSDGASYGYACDGDPFADVGAEDTDSPESSDETKEQGKLLSNLYNVGKSQVQNILSLGGVNFMMKTRRFASNFIPEKSWVRLYQGADNQKLGGGHRVKQIAVNDNWSEVKPLENSSTYGTRYIYTTKNEDNNQFISSGVASYEPITSGADENSYRKPEAYIIDVKMRVNDNEFQDLPIGESIFASSQVVYSKVEIKNLDYTDVSDYATGQTIYEFYTARDFPSIVQKTMRADVSAVETKSPFWLSLLTGESYEYLTMNQGYSIQINDMHGKFKSKTVTAERATAESDPVEVYSMKHKYYEGIKTPRTLNNDLLVVDANGNISTKFIGKDIDMVMDLTESKSYSESQTFQFGVEVSTGLVIPSAWVSKTSQDNRFRSSVTTKVVYSNGILEEIELKDKGRVKRTKNLIFDEQTGVPVVTEILHETGATAKPIYQYDYPAYWMYEGMGMASENWGATFADIANADAKITLASYEDFFNPGDEVAISEIVNPEVNNFIAKAWVLESELTGEYFLIDEFGDKIWDNDAYDFDSEKSYHYKVIRSGKRNLLGSTAASVTSLTYNASAYGAPESHTNVLNASAVEYTENAFGYESSKTEQGSTLLPDLCGLMAGQKVNPYVRGLRANWNLLASYVFDEDRDQTVGQIREDGILSSYVTMWQNSVGGWALNTDPIVAEKWIKAAIATIFEPEGYNLESKDALGIYSSILLGYNNSLKTAEAVNARYYEIGFDGFEDRGYDVFGDCSKPHFRFNNGEIVDNPEFSHSGRNALKVMPGAYAYRTSQIVNDIDHTTTHHGAPYIVQAEELIPTHSFIIDESESQRFVLTAWVKEENNATQITTYDGVHIDINVPGVTDIIEKRTNIIDGWQRIEIEFTLPGSVISSALDGTIELHNESLSNIVYFDDVRIQPFNSEMVSYVIDPLTMRLWATLDSRNFATFYQYDEEGSLVRIIQETERGKVTVQENRAGIRID